jgi:Aerobic-type carbon monoxide dehydrogenase, large subunit CoxL/CutL homologs
MNTVGNSITRLDVFAKVTGKAKYPGDFQFSDQLVMKVLFAHRAHARVLDVDTTQAESLDGVVMVLTAKDVPVNEYGLGVNDQPVLCGPGSGIEGADVVRFEGDQVALVIAESEEIATEALKRIVVSYEDLPVVKTLGEALKKDAPILHSRLDSNIFHHNVVRSGSTDEAFKNCAVIVEGEYQTPVQEHAYLQPESGVSFMDEKVELRSLLLVSGLTKIRNKLRMHLDCLLTLSALFILPLVGRLAEEKTRQFRSFLDWRH